METGRLSSSYRYSETTTTTTTRQTHAKGDPAADRSVSGASLGLHSVRSGDGGKEPLSWQVKVVKSEIRAGQVYTVAGASKLGERNIDIYVTQNGKVHQSSPGNRLIHYGTGDELKELKPGEARIEKSKVDQEFYFLGEGTSKQLQRGKVYAGTGSTPDTYVSPKGKLIQATPDGKLFQVGVEDELVEYKPDPRGYKHHITKNKEHFIVTSDGFFPLKPCTVYSARGDRPELYLSQDGHLTAASSTEAKLLKLDKEDQAVEYAPNENGFNFVVSKKGNPFVVTSKTVTPLKPGALYAAHQGRPPMYVSKECVLTKASDTTSRLLKLGEEDEAVEYKPDLSNFNLKVSKKGNPYRVTSMGTTLLTPGTLYRAQRDMPAFYLSSTCELTTASSRDARLFKLGEEDQAVEYKHDVKGFNYVVSRQGNPFLVMSTAASPLMYDKTVTLKLPTGRDLEVTPRRGRELQHRFVN